MADLPLLESFSLSDFALTIDGDIQLTNTGDLIIVYADDFLTQEIGLIFRNQINPKAYIGQRTVGTQGAILGDIIKEDVLAELQINESIDERELHVEVYPMPGDKIVIEISRDVDSDDPEPLLSATLNFSQGRIEGYERTNPASNTVYNETLDSIVENEIVRLDIYSSVIEVSHIPSSLYDMYVYNIDDIENLEGSPSGTTKTASITLDEVEPEPPGIFRINELFPEISGLGIHKPILSVTVTNENDTDIEHILEGVEITLTGLPEEYTDLTISIIYSVCVAKGIDFNVQEHTQSIPEFRRMLFPHDRIMGNIYLYLSNTLAPGTYIVSYLRYPSRIGEST